MRNSSHFTCPSRLIHPTNQLAQGPYCPVSMNDQKYRPPETGNLEESSLIASPTSMLKNPVATQPQMSTAGPPYNSPWPYSPTTTAAQSKDYHTEARLDCSHSMFTLTPLLTCNRSQGRHDAQADKSVRASNATGGAASSCSPVAAASLYRYLS